MVSISNLKCVCVCVIINIILIIQCCGNVVPQGTASPRGTIFTASASNLSNVPRSC